MNPQAILKELTPRARIGLAGAVVAMLVVTFFLLKLATAPSYATVMTGIEPAKADSITTALAARGVAYELKDGGTSLAVQKSQIGEAQIALANAGVKNSGDQPGFELLDQQKLGSSDFQQQVTYQRALEGEIANTVGKIDGVNGAQVQLTLPQDKLFSSDATPATAAVLLNGGTSLDNSQIRGIAGLVSSSVSGLKADNVTITGGDGQMLWPTSAGGDGGSSAKTAAQAKYDAQIEGNVNQMLARTLGPNKAQVEVNSDLNMDTSTKQELAYADKGTPLESNKDIETLKGSTPSGGTSGTAANIQGSTAAGGTAGSDYSHKIEKDTLGVGKTVTNTKVAPGAVNSLKVALLVDSTVKVPQIDLENMVNQAAGINTKRGDTLTFSQFAFAKTTASKPSALPITPTGIIGVLKYILAGLAAIVFLFLASRALRRREAADLSEPKWLTEIESPRPLAELVAQLEAGAGDNANANALEAGLQGSSREQLAAVAAQDPERLARQLRNWMAEGEPTA